MTLAQIEISGILLVAMLMFGIGRWRYDLVAMAALMIGVLLGVVPAEQAFSGFAHPAVITVAAVLIISGALRNAGVVDEVASRISHLTETPLMHITVLTLVVTVASAFMNNVGALALMLPVALSSAEEQGRSPAMLLMPLAFGSLLGGMTTLIGTPPNIIVANIRTQTAGEPFGMFDFAPVGLPVAIGGLLFVILIGWRLIPAARRNQGSAGSMFETGRYLTEVHVPEQSPLVGEALGQMEALAEESLEVIGVAGKRQFVRPVGDDYRIAAGDTLLVTIEVEELQPFLDHWKLELRSSATPAFVEPDPDNEVFVEAVVSNDSVLVDRGVEFFRRKTMRAVALVGIARNGHTVSRRLRQQRFSAGDVLLLRADLDNVSDHLSTLGVWPLASRELALGRERRVLLALGVFALAIAAGIAGLVTLPIAFMLTIMVYLLTGILSVRQIYDDIDWPVMVLLAAMIPIGNALTDTGTTQLLADQLAASTEGLPAWLILTLVLVVTMLLSDVINNAATALVMAPLGIALAHSLGVNSDPFLMAVAVGASCAFLTPIGHQCNTLVMGPGGYKFGDYWRMGLPLEVLITALAVPMILLVWPL